VQCWDDSVPAVEIPCADATCPGQDGFYTNACPNGPTRFVDNGNETVTDTCTGLVWQKTSAGGFPWCDALTFCEGLALAGQNDWRLPSIRELESLLDYARPPAFDPVFVGPNSAHWSSTSVADPGPGAFAWYVNFSGGDVSGSGKNNANQVRAVRGVSGLPESGQTLCYDAAGAVIPCADTGACPGQDGFYATGCSNTPRFIDNLNDTVTDTCTGLMWQKNTGNGETALAWCGALAYCEGLSLASRSDWRLPNARELHSLLDYGSRGPALDPLFSAVVGQGSWASTSQTGFARNAWYFGLDIGSPFEGGASSTSSKQTLLHVRAIRDAP
jgi:hypothetical protein